MSPATTLKRWLRMVRHGVMLWNRHGCIDLGASFAFHSLQSILPFLLLCLGLGAWFFGRETDTFSSIVRTAENLLPAPASRLLVESLQALVRQARGAGIIGALTLLVSAGNAALSLQRGADRLWGLSGVGPQPAISWQQAVRHWLFMRFKASLVALLLAVVLVVNQLVSPLPQLARALAFFPDLLLPGGVPLAGTGATQGVLDALLGWSGLLLLSLLLLWVLPSRPPAWRVIVPGAFCTATGLLLAKPLLLHLVLWLGRRFQAYGILGGVLVLTLWVWLVGLLLYLGMVVGVTWSVGRRSARQPAP